MKKKNIDNVLTESTRNAFDTLVGQYSNKMLDKILENAVVKNKSLEEISIKDVFDAEASIENERERIAYEKERKSLFANYIYTAFAFTISMILLISKLAFKDIFINNVIFETIQILLSTILLFMLIKTMNGMISAKKNESENAPENIKWMIVKQWSEIEKIVTEKLKNDGKDIISPIEIVKWIQTQEDISNEEKADIKNILKIRNETVHAVMKSEFKLIELVKYEELASSILDKVSRRKQKKIT